jgi:hypothetical protein
MRYRARLLESVLTCQDERWARVYARVLRCYPRARFLSSLPEGEGIGAETPVQKSDAHLAIGERVEWELKSSYRHAAGVRS